MTTTPTTSAGPRVPTVAGRARGALAFVVLAAAMSLAGAVAGVGTASAQTTTRLAPPTTLPAENPGSTGAGIVFFGVTGVIIVGALVLYLRNRRPKVPNP